MTSREFYDALFGPFGLFAEPVKLTLTYRGPLPSGSNAARLETKWKMRRLFHEQLQELWNHTVPLCYLVRDVSGKYLLGRVPGNNAVVWETCAVPPFRFLPLVIPGPYMKLVCHLDVELLTRQQVGHFFDATTRDLDNRIKVLFDSLRVPDQNQIKAMTPTESEDPFFVLLQDDKLITKMSIESRRLLRPPIPPEQNDDVELNIRVTVEAGEGSEPFPY